jgi:hypothetical protein
MINAAKCTRCGAINRANQYFCSSCGLNLHAEGGSERVEHEGPEIQLSDATDKLETTMRLLPGESIVSETSDKQLMLTTHRVRYDDRVPGTTRVIGITLDAVSSCGIISKSHPILLLLAILAGIFGLVQGVGGESDGQGMAYASILLALVIVMAYFLSCTMALAISSPGQSITVSMRGLNLDALVAWVDDVEQAKLRYLDKLVDSVGVQARNSMPGNLERAAGA